jgi:hypothetical protein
MTGTSAVFTLDLDRPAPTGRLFKADRPRTIDRHIDYFGGASADGDLCGEVLLDLLDADGDGR